MPRRGAAGPARLAALAHTWPRRSPVHDHAQMRQSCCACGGCGGARSPSCRRLRQAASRWRRREGPVRRNAAPGRRHLGVAPHGARARQCPRRGRSVIPRHGCRGGPSSRMPFAVAGARPDRCASGSSCWCSWPLRTSRLRRHQRWRPPRAGVAASATPPSPPPCWGRSTPAGTRGPT
jgi:hypothetical protein